MNENIQQRILIFMENPWLQIPANDYEGHMSSANVGQLNVLSKIFYDVLKEIKPESLMVLGCATGNGFEHIDKITKVVGVDINAEYLDECRKRFDSKISKLELICADLNLYQHPEESFDLIHAALIFEYVGLDIILPKIFSWIKPKGYLSVVLQLGSETSEAITKTKYDSLKKLASIHKLISPENFLKKCSTNNFVQSSSREVKLKGDKKFRVMIFQKE